MLDNNDSYVPEYIKIAAGGFDNLQRICRKDNKMDKIKYHWQIDDKVYFFLGMEDGSLPTLCRGIVEEIRRDEIRVKVSGKDFQQLIWISTENCYNDSQKLKQAFLENFETKLYNILNPDNPIHD